MGWILVGLVKQFERNVASTNVRWEDSGDYWYVECLCRVQARVDGASGGVMLELMAGVLAGC